MTKELTKELTVDDIKRMAKDRSWNQKMEGFGVWHVNAIMTPKKDISIDRSSWGAIRYRMTWLDINGERGFGKTYYYPQPLVDKMGVYQKSNVFYRFDGCIHISSLAVTQFFEGRQYQVHPNLIRLAFFLDAKSRECPEPAFWKTLRLVPEPIRTVTLHPLLLVEIGEQDGFWRKLIGETPKSMGLMKPDGITSTIGCTERVTNENESGHERLPVGDLTTHNITEETFDFSELAEKDGLFPEFRIATPLAGLSDDLLRAMGIQSSSGRGGSRFPGRNDEYMKQYFLQGLVKPGSTGTGQILMYLDPKTKKRRSSPVVIEQSGRGGVRHFEPPTPANWTEVTPRLANHIMSQHNRTLFMLWTGEVPIGKFVYTNRNLKPNDPVTPDDIYIKRDRTTQRGHRAKANVTASEIMEEKGIPADSNYYAFMGYVAPQTQYAIGNTVVEIPVVAPIRQRKERILSQGGTDRLLKKSAKEPEALAVPETVEAKPIPGVVVEVDVEKDIFSVAGDPIPEEKAVIEEIPAHTYPYLTREEYFEGKYEAFGPSEVDLSISAEVVQCRPVKMMRTGDISIYMYVMSRWARTGDVECWDEERFENA